LQSLEGSFETLSADPTADDLTSSKVRKIMGGVLRTLGLSAQFQTFRQARLTLRTTPALACAAALNIFTFAHAQSQKVPSGLRRDTSSDVQNPLGRVLDICVNCRENEPDHNPTISHPPSSP
jgi:hypothetical protein